MFVFWLQQGISNFRVYDKYHHQEHEWRSHDYVAFPHCYTVSHDYVAFPHCYTVSHEYWSLW